MQNSGQKNGARIDYKFTTPLVFFKMKLTGQACGIGRRVAKKKERLAHATQATWGLGDARAQAFTSYEISCTIL
jgi:hypothetical protein